MILGIDEVGRGSWAGPLVVGACVLPNGCQIEGLADSKLLTKLRRQKLEPIIRQQAIAFGLGWVSAGEVDELGLSAALRLAAERATLKINPSLYDRIIIDGTVDFLDSPRVTVMKKADQLVPSVSAAAILAKVARDDFMITLTEQLEYRPYEFAKHVGYGTKLHRERLLEYGPSDQHRRSFKPVAQMLGDYHLPNAKQIGDRGETLACQWLRAHGYEILSRNWKTKFFEIDVVAKKDSEIFLVEVKSRKNQDFGGGLAGITNQKLVKMRRAADQLMKMSRFKNYDFRLAVLTITAGEVDGDILLVS